jgi:hypothetical protein
MLVRPSVVSFDLVAFSSRRGVPGLHDHVTVRFLAFWHRIIPSRFGQSRCNRISVTPASLLRYGVFQARANITLVFRVEQQKGRGAFRCLR